MTSAKDSAGRQAFQGARGGRGDAGEQVADPFLAAYQDGHTRTVRLALALCGDLGAAEEVAQEAWIGAYRRHQTTGVDAPMAYVRSSIVNLLRNRARRGIVERSYLRLVKRDRPVDGSARASGQVEDRMTVVPLLQRLPERMRTVLALRFYADLSVADTAAAMGISEGTVKSTTSKALAKLREIWEEDHHG